MNQGPQQQAIDINALPYEVSHEILKYLDLKEHTTLSSLNSFWYSLVRKSDALINRYFPYLLAQRENEINANAFNVFKEEYRRYKKLFYQTNMSFILEALSGSLAKITQIKNRNFKIKLYALFMSNAHLLPDELLKENKGEIISQALLFAASNGQFQVMKDLLTREEITPTDKGCALERAAENGQLEIVEYLLTLAEITPVFKSSALKAAAGSGYLEIVKQLSTLPEITPHHKGWALYFATYGCHFEIVVHLSALPNITPHNKGEALFIAVKENYLEIVKHLLTLPEITAEHKSLALYQAAGWGLLDIVKHLLTLPEITPQHKVQALKAAAEKVHLTIVKHLLTLPEIPLYDKGTFLRQLTWRDQLEIAKYLFTLQTGKDHRYLTYPKRAITAIQAALNLPFLQRHKTALSRLMLATTMCLGLTAKFPLISAGRSIFLGYSAGAMLVSMLLSTLYQRYMERTFVNYNTPEKIQTITDAGEMQALKSGMDAKTWLGYAKSFTVYATYRQMSAFNAGKKCALNDAHPSLAEIAKLRVF